MGDLYPIPWYGVYISRRGPTGCLSWAWMWDKRVQATHVFFISRNLTSMNAESGWLGGNDIITIAMSMTTGSLRELIEEIYQDKAKWVYKRNEEKFREIDIFKKEMCKSFIESYFDCTGKGDVDNTLLNSLEGNDSIDANRCQHIVMTFFYGLLLYDKCRTIKKTIDKFLSADKYKMALEKHKDAPFAYVWFLVCLFHDLAYPLEYKRGGKRDFKSYQELSEKKKWDKDLDGVPHQYSREILEHYFDYRNSGDDAMNDHGICAGHYLYADLCAIQERKKMQRSNKSWWKDELKVIFNLAAWVVACHNIWSTQEDNDNVETYRGKNLEALILERDNEGKLQYLIKLEEHPLLFLFCLVDTIEPIKIVEDVSLLDKIRLEIADEGIRLEIDLICGCRTRLLKNIRSLNDWLTKTEIEGNIGRICFHNS